MTATPVSERVHVERTAEARRGHLGEIRSRHFAQGKFIFNINILEPF
jgi:hypothetical protein